MADKTFFDSKIGNNKIIIDTIYTISLTSVNFFAKTILEGDVTRFVYASNEEAFYQRMQDLQRRRIVDGNVNNLSGLDFPFANYKITELDSSELNWNHSNYVRGFFEPELGGMIRFRPVRFKFEATAWFYNLNDAHIAYNRLMWEEDNTTLLKPVFTITNGKDVNKDIELYAYLNIDSTFNPTYDFGDYREQGDIHTFTFDFELETAQIFTNFEVKIPESVVISYARAFDKNVVLAKDADTYIINHFEKTITDPPQ